MPLFNLSAFFDCGRAIRCLLPLGSGRFMILVVLYGYQGADSDAEQLALTEHLFDAALEELGVVAGGQPSLIVGDFNEEPTKIPCLAKGISAGLWVDLEAACALARGVQPAVTCERTWDSTGGHPRVFMVGCTLAAAAAVSSCRVEHGKWVSPHLVARTHLDCGRWTSRVTQLVQRTPLWPAAWLAAVDKSQGSKSLEVQRVWDFHDDRVAKPDALRLDESLLVDDVSHAWLVWYGFVWLGWVVLRFARRVVMLLMFMRLVMSLCIVTPPLPFCWTSGARSRLSWMYWIP